MALRLHFRWKLFLGFFSFAVIISTAVGLFAWHRLFVVPGLAAGATAADGAIGHLDRTGLLAALLQFVALSIVAALPPAFFIASRLNRPIREITRTISEVERGNLDARARRLHTLDEFEPLTDQLNVMLDRLRERQALETTLDQERSRSTTLESIRGELETHVRKRTEELATIARSLHAEIQGHSTTLELLSASETRFRTLVAHAPVAIVESDAQGALTFVNEQWSVLTGQTADDALGRGWLDAVHADDRSAVEHAWERTLANSEPFTRSFRVRSRSGEVRWVEGRARPLTRPGIGASGLLGTVTDVTEREQAARERERIFNISLDPICLAGTDGYMKRVNGAFERVLETPAAELLSRPFIDFVHPDDVGSTREQLRGLASGLPTVNFQNRYRCGDGSYRYLEWNAVPVPEEGLIYAIARDITDFRRAEQAERDLLATRLQLSIARDIQLSFLPKLPPAVDGLDIAGISLPAESVGGDYYDFIPCGAGCWSVPVADASGHGIGATLLVAQARASLWSLTGRDPDLQELLAQTNRVLVEGTPPNAFVTLFMLVADPASRTVRYASCGHPPAWIVAASGELKARLEATEPPLGIFPEAGLAPPQVVTLARGDVLVITTDGVTEAENVTEGFYGEERAVEVVRAARAGSAAEIVGALIGDVRAFCGDTPPADDVTALVLKVPAAGPEISRGG